MIRLTSPSVLGVWRLHPWLPMVLLGFPVALLWWHDRRPPRGRCVRCGYNLTGLTINRCPECGAEFDASTQHSWKERGRISEVNP